jgi:hypothetical protein
MSTEAERLKALEKEVSRLKVELRHLVDFLATVQELPILGPNRKQVYEEGKKKALEDIEQGTG